MRVKLAALLVAAMSGMAEAGPNVVTDIPPVHSLVAGVMGDTGSPELILRPGASPHGYAMAPSEARALAGADVVIWIGPGLTPWLDRAAATLAPNARSVELIAADGIRTLPFREGATFEAHDHEAHAEDHDEHEHDNHGHDEHGHDEHGHEEHGHEGEDEDGHHDEHAQEAGEADPHIWLDPRNAQAITRAIVEALSETDPANAALYARNGDTLITRLSALERDMVETLAGSENRPFIVFHDAYHYLEARFGVEAAGAITISDATQPGPARLTEIRNAIAAFDTPCIFTEPQFPEAHARLVMEGTDAELAALDPMGVAVERGPDLYFTMMRGMAGAMASCLKN